MTQEYGFNICNSRFNHNENNVTKEINQLVEVTNNVPSLASSAMLVDLQISQFTGRKLDKKASEEVTVSNNADKGVANVHKKLLGNCKELDDIKKHVGETRNHYHYAMTMPWSNMGLRLIDNCLTTSTITRLMTATTD
jgi:hypothetical protein